MALARCHADRLRRPPLGRSSHRREARETPAEIRNPRSAIRNRMNLEALRDEKEAAAAAIRADRDRWLQIVQIFTPVVAREAAAGNPACRTALVKAAPFLPTLTAP